MKTIRRFLFVISIFYASYAFAFIPPPPGPISPVIDGINDVVMTGKALMKKFRTVADQVQYYRDEALNAIKSAKNFVRLDLEESPLQKKENEPVLAAVKEVTESDLGDVKSEEDVSNIFKQLFLTYPIELLETFPVQQKEEILKRYRDKSVEFSNDSMMELYLSIRDLEENRLPVMKKEIDDLSNCLVAGRSGDSTLCGSVSDADEELGNAVNKYKLAELQDTYYRMYQELSALKTQYEAGLALQEGLSPLNEDEALSTNPSEEQTPATKNPSINFEIPNPFQEKTPFEGAEENMTALPILDGIYELLSSALYLHNTKQQLPDLRRPFIEYEKMQALHEKSVEKVAESEEKSRNYFANYYSNADSLWFGDGCSLRKEHIGKKCPNLTGCKSTKEYVNYYVYVVMCPNGVFQVIEYDKKRGLSKHAYDLYTGSKVDMVLSLNNDEEQTSQNQIDGVAVVDMEMDTTVPDIDEDVDLEGMIGGGDDLVKDADASYAEGVVREQEVNRWQIGSIESLRVGNDMNAGVSKYGLKAKYPLWGDEMRFYNQYLREKYRNMELHFNNPIIAAPMFDLADRMNGDMSVSSSARSQCHNKAQERKDYKYKYQCWKDEWYQDYKYECTKNSETDEDECKWVLDWFCCEKVPDYACRSEASRVAQEEENKCNQDLDKLLAEEKNGNRTIISTARSAFENNQAIAKFLTSSELEELKRKHDAALDALEAKYKQNLVSAFNARNEASNKLNAVMDRLNGEKSQYNDLMGQKKDHESEAKAQDQVMDIGEERSKENPDTPYYTNIPNEAKEKQLQEEEETDKAAQEAQKHQGPMQQYQRQADEYRDQIAKADENIEKIKKDYIAEAVALEHEQLKEMKTRLENRIAEIKALPLPSFGGGTKTIGTIANYANQMFMTFKNNAINEVVRAYNSIVGLGRTKYEADRYTGSIYPIHKNMLAKINGVTYPNLSATVATVSAGVDTISGAFLVTNAGSIPIAVSRFAQIALDSECDSSKEDEEYFVSLKGESCDLTAPKRLFGDRTAPVRETFHFDSDDYSSVVKTDQSKPKTTRREFLKVCREVPKVWQLIMEPDGFVQRDVDVEDILAGNDLTKEFLEAKGEKPVGGNDQFSELSIFLKYKSGLTFTNEIISLAKFFDDTRKTKQKKKMDTKEANEKKKMFLARDQVGDYLQFVDLEQTYRTQMIQLKTRVNEGKKTIEEALEKALCEPKRKSVGYVKTGEEGSKFVSSEFIADNEVYESVAACLDQGKNMYIAEAVKMMQTLPELTDYLKERKKKLDDMLKTMQTDSEELVQLSDNTEPDGAFEEKIKSKRTDNQVVDKYAKEAEEEFKNNLNNFEVPYQARYF